MTSTIEPVTAPITAAPSESRPACLDDPAAVVAWLRSLSPDAVCGRAYEPQHCPLARYLATHYDWAEDISVGLLTYRVGERHTALPLWALYFVKRVDAIPERHTQAQHSGSVVTAAEALEVLESVIALKQAL